MTLKKLFSANYSVQPDDEVIVVETGSPDIILPYATGTGRVITISNLGISKASLAPQKLDTIQGIAYYDLNDKSTVQLMDIENQRWITL